MNQSVPVETRSTFRAPVRYTIDVKFRVNDEEFQEKPFGESIFANPSVVYGQVTVRNKEYTELNNEQSGSDGI